MVALCPFSACSVSTRDSLWEGLLHSFWGRERHDFLFKANSIVEESEQRISLPYFQVCCPQQMSEKGCLRGVRCSSCLSSSTSASLHLWSNFSDQVRLCLKARNSKQQENTLSHVLCVYHTPTSSPAPQDYHRSPHLLELILELKQKRCWCVFNVQTLACISDSTIVNDLVSEVTLLSSKSRLFLFCMNVLIWLRRRG